jgi:hypothetical protein
MQSLASATFSILDAATMGPAFKDAATRQPYHSSLYGGESEQNLASVAPYLFPFSVSSDFGKWLISSGWGHSWGVHIVTSASHDELRQHLRKFLIVKTEQGKELYFRYYDPRVLRAVLPTLEMDQLRQFFGPVDEWLMEDDSSSLIIRFRLAESLQVTRLPITEYPQPIREARNV